MILTTLNDNNEYTVIHANYQRSNNCGAFLGDRQVYLQFAHFINDSVLLFGYNIGVITIKKLQIAANIETGISNVTDDIQKDTDTDSWMITQIIYSIDDIYQYNISNAYLFEYPTNDGYF